MTPVSGLTQAGNRSAASAKLARWVIQGVVSMRPVSICWMMRPKSARQRVAAGQERQLAPVEVGVVEGDLPLEQTHERQPPAVRGVLEGGGHRTRAARGVEHRRGQVAAGETFFKASSTFSFAPLIVCGAPSVRRQNSSRSSLMSSTITRAPASMTNCVTARPDGSRADHQRELFRLHRRALDGVRADAERFHQRQLVERQLGGRVQLARGQRELLAHPAVRVDAEHLDGRAGSSACPGGRRYTARS